MNFRDLGPRLKQIKVRGEGDGPPHLQKSPFRKLYVGPKAMEVKK